MQIEKAYPSDYPGLIELWEASVRETHHFLQESDIQYFKPLILEKYFDLVDLYVIKADGIIIGFLGLAGGMIQMLFVHPNAHGKGIGRSLVRFAIDEHHVKKVEVNEQNEQALGFYLHMGFKVTHREPLDGLGKPYPILSMELA